MRNIYVKKTTYTGIMIALVFIGTSIIKLPTPLTNGYIHLGDAFVLLSGYILGPIWGGLAAGIGSGLADFLSPYAIWTIPTFFIKGIAAAIIGWSRTSTLYLNQISKQEETLQDFKLAKKNNNKNVIIGIFLSGTTILIGYYIASSVMYGSPILPLLEIPINLLQFIVGLIIAAFLLPYAKKLSKNQY